MVKFGIIRKGKRVTVSFQVLWLDNRSLGRELQRAALCRELEGEMFAVRELSLVQ